MAGDSVGLFAALDAGKLNAGAVAEAGAEPAEGFAPNRL